MLIGSPGDAPDIQYGSGFRALDPMVFFKNGTRVFLVVPVLELGRARKEAPRATVLTPQDLPIEPEDRRRVAEWALGLLRHLRVRSIQVTHTFPAGILRHLEQKGIRVTVQTAPAFPARAVKSGPEIKCIALSQAAAVAATNAAIRMIRAAGIGRSGELTLNRRALTSERVRYEVDATLLKHGCFARDTIIAGGRQAADPHDRGHGPLRAGQTIVLDIFPQHKTSGYWGDITRTVIKGPATPAQRAMYRAVLKAQLRALALVRPGMPVRRIHEEVQRVFDEAGFPTEVKDGVARGFFHGTGHGVGLDIHEAPSVSPNDAKLRVGHVITIEPGLYYPEHGGVRIEDTVVVTRAGCKFLATCGKGFQLP